MTILTNFHEPICAFLTNVMLTPHKLFCRYPPTHIHTPLNHTLYNIYPHAQDRHFFAADIVFFYETSCQTQKSLYIVTIENFCSCT